MGNGSIGMVTGLAGAVALMAAVALATVSPAAAVVFGVVAVGTVMAVSTTLTGIFTAALYRFAVTGEARPPFNDFDLADAFRRRGSSPAWRPRI